MVRVHAEVAAEVAAAIHGGDVRLTTDSVDIAIREGVAPLLAASPAAASLDTGARQRLAAHAHGAAVQAAALDHELRRLLPALAAGGTHPVLVIKGAHLAHAVYPAPHLRPRSDSDLLIAATDRDAITAALERAGYLPAALVNGRLLLGSSYHRTLGPGMVHDVDVHWRAAAPLASA